MWRLLIVDDEIENVQWLKEMFQYESEVEFDVSIAYSGKQALQILNETRMDIVLTDIKMPGMDGLGLYHHIKENWPMAKVIFLTGYRDYETLYEIIKNGEAGYILKTEGEDVIKQAVQDAVLELERQRKERQAKEENQMILSRARFWLQKEWVENLILGIEKEVSAQQLADLEIPLQAEYPMLCYVGRTSLMDMDAARRYQEQAKLLEKIDENMPGVVRFYGCFVENSYLLLLIQPKIMDDYIDWKRVFHITQGVLEYLAEQEDTAAIDVFAVSEAAISFEQLAEQYDRLKRGIIRKHPEQTTVVINLCEEPEEEKPEEESWYRSVMARIPMLETFLEHHEQEKFQELLEQITNPLRLVKSRHDPDALAVYYNISLILLKFIISNQLNTQIPFHIAIYKLTKADEHENWEQAVKYLFVVSDVLFQLIGEEDSYRTDQALKKVEQYIEQHLDGELTLTSLANVGGFNASYLSRIFKQSRHCNLSEYIVQARIQKAKKLLLETNYKVSKVAEDVGYFSQHSFNRVFKNSEGMTPMEFRTKYKVG